MTDAEVLFRSVLGTTGVVLSKEGEARRAAMRTQLTQVVVRQRRVRAAVRTAVSLTVALGLLLAWLAHREEDPHAKVEIVHDQPGMVALVRALPPSTVTIERIGDDQLVDLLASTEHPAGLVRLPGKLLLAPHAGFDTD